MPHPHQSVAHRNFKPRMICEADFPSRLFPAAHGRSLSCTGIHHGPREVAARSHNHPRYRLARAPRPKLPRRRRPSARCRRSSQKEIGRRRGPKLGPDSARRSAPPRARGIAKRMVNGPQKEIGPAVGQKPRRAFFHPRVSEVVMLTVRLAHSLLGNTEVMRCEKF